MPSRPPQHVPLHDHNRHLRRREPSRQSAASRGYDHAWRKFRLAVLARTPLCQDCSAAGRVTAAVDVHHVELLRMRPDLRLDFSNVLALCHECHSARTGRGE